MTNQIGLAESCASSVWVNWLDQDEDLWIATWQQDFGHESESFQGPRDAVIDWAFGIPAERRLIFSSETDDWVALEQW